jgi:hypothetical protein
VSAVTQVQSTARVTDPAAIAEASTPGEASLLPPPSPGALGTNAGLSMLYYLESKDGQDGIQSGTKKVQGLDTERKQALDKELKAIQQQDEAAKHHDFWSDLGNTCGEIAKVASVVASVAAAVGTCGAGAPLAAVAIAGAALSTAGFLDGETHVLQKLGVDAGTADLVDMGMSLAGAAASVGAGIAAGGKAASSATEIVGRTAAVTAGVASVGKGASAIEASQALAAEDRAVADQLDAQGQSDTLQRAVQRVLDEVSDADHKSQQVLKTLSGAQATQMQTMTLAASGVKG